MKKIIGGTILCVARWKTAINVDRDVIKKCVMIGAPHTTNWDTIYLAAVLWKESIAAKFLIKDKHTKAIYGSMVKGIGGLGVDRSKNNNLVEFSVNLLNTTDELAMIVPAEGTRKRVEAWRKGFYHIAKKANVPVALGYLDYKRKEAGIGKIVYLTDDFEADMQEIEDFYTNITGKYPENYNPKIYKRSK